MLQRGALFVVSGFAGAGKGTIVKRIVSERKEMALSVSMTTRAPRPGEVDGREYFFVSKEEFEAAIEREEFLEYARYVDNCYGTPKKYVMSQLEKGRDVILEIEVQGALQVKKKFPDAVLIFVTPPSGTILCERLVNRGTETAEVVKNRMHRALEESSYMSSYDFILVNDDLEKAVSDIKTIIDASHLTPRCNEVFINKIEEELKAYK